MATETFYYDNKIVRNFAIATVIWGYCRNAGRHYHSVEADFPGIFWEESLNCSLWSSAAAAYQCRNFRLCR